MKVILGVLLSGAATAVSKLVGLFPFRRLIYGPILAFYYSLTLLMNNSFAHVVVSFFDDVACTYNIIHVFMPLLLLNDIYKP